MNECRLWNLKWHRNKWEISIHSFRKKEAHSLKATPPKIKSILARQKQINNQSSINFSLSLSLSLFFISRNGLLFDVIPDWFQSFREFILIGIRASGSTPRSSPRLPPRSHASILSCCSSPTRSQSYRLRVLHHPHQVPFIVFSFSV